MSRIAAVLVSLATVSCTGIMSTPDGSGSSTVEVVEPDAGRCIDLKGTVSTLAQGTYCVTGDVIIPTGVTLDIPAGTTFIVKGRYHFGRDMLVPDLEPPAIEGSGSIRAIGTAEAPIVFRGETPDTQWYGLVISHTHDPVHLEYVTISDTYKDDRNRDSVIWRRGGALNSYVNKKGTILRHCTFTNNRSWSAAGAVEIFSHGYWPDTGLVEITDSRFENNACECEAYSPNATDKCGGGALRLMRVNGDEDLVKISNNVFKNNKAMAGDAGIPSFGGAISGARSGVILGAGNVFEGNSAASGDGAISCNNEPMLGSVVDEVNPAVVFTNNTPNNGCGK